MISINKHCEYVVCNPTLSPCLRYIARSYTVYTSRASPCTWRMCGRVVVP